MKTTLLIVLLVLVFLFAGCLSYPLTCGGSTWFRRCSARVVVPPEQVAEYSVQKVEYEPRPWRICYRYDPDEPWVQVWGSPGFLTKEAAEESLLMAAYKAAP